MWWREGDLPGPRPRTAVAALLALAGLVLAGCGFQPLYSERATAGTEAGVGEDLAAIEVGLIPDRAGQLLRFELQSAFAQVGEAPAPRWRLDVGLHERGFGTVIALEDTVVRANLATDATFQLIDLSEDAPVYRNRVSSVSGYNIVRSDYATLVAEDDARRRNVEQLKDLIRLDLAALFARAADDPEVLKPMRPRPAVDPDPDDPETLAPGDRELRDGPATGPMIRRLGPDARGDDRRDSLR